MLISWQGRGLVGLAAVLLVPAGGGLATLVKPNAMTLGIALGLTAAGGLCAGLGIWWNRNVDLHFLGPFRLQTCGYVYLLLGCLMLPAGVHQLSEPPLTVHPSGTPRHP